MIITVSEVMVRMAGRPAQPLPDKLPELAGPPHKPSAPLSKGWNKGEIGTGID